MPKSEPVNPLERWFFRSAAEQRPLFGKTSPTNNKMNNRAAASISAALRSLTVTLTVTGLRYEVVFVSERTILT